MYEKCLNCDRLGKDCITNFYTMSVQEIRAWAKKMKEKKGWSNADLAKASGVPKGTIDSSFSRHAGKDVTYSTFAPILCALIGCEGEMLCFKDNARAEKIEAENASLRAQMASMKEDYENRLAYFRDQLKWKKQVIIILITVSLILLAFVLIYAFIDLTHPDAGFFQR